MSDKITSSQIFLFLAKQTNWKEEADTNKSDPLTKGEMRVYLNSEEFKDFAGVKIQDVSSETFDKFWAKLDNQVNNNKLDENELASADETISKYEALNQKISSLKGEVSGTINANRLGQWEGRLAELLMAKVDNNEITIDELLNDNNEINKAFNQATAEVLADQYKGAPAVRSLISDTGIDYDITKDETLTNIINQYINKVILAAGEDGNIAQKKAADIDSAIKNLIANYLKEANLTKDNIEVDDSIDLSQYGYDKNVLNDAQKAVLVKKISDTLSSEKSKFSGYEKEFDEVLNKFIENYIATNDITAEGGKSLFQTILGKTNEIKNAFTSSDDYKHLKNTVAVYKNYRDNIDSTFKSAVQEALGDNADLFLNNCKTSKDYDAILQSIISRLDSGDEALMKEDGTTIDWTKVQSDIIASVTALISGASTASGELSALKTDYEKNSSDIEKAREKAITYCDTAKAKGDEYAEAVEKVFGSNHKSTIEGIDDTITLATKMKTLFGLIDKIVDENIDESKITWNDNSSAKAFFAGSATEFSCTATLNNNNVNTNDITYGITAGANCSVTLKNNSTGTFTLEPIQAGRTTATITVYYKDKAIGTKEIVVVAQEDPLEEKLKTLNYTGGYELCGKVKGLSSAATTAQKNLCVLLSKMKTALGSSSDRVNNAITTLTNYYSAILGAMTVRDNNGTVGGDNVQYYNAMTNSYVNTSDKSNMRSAYDGDDVNSYNEIKEKCNSGTTGLYIGHDKEKGEDKFNIYIDQSVVFNKLRSLLTTGSL